MIVVVVVDNNNIINKTIFLIINDHFPFFGKDCVRTGEWGLFLTGEGKNTVERRISTIVLVV